MFIIGIVILLFSFFWFIFYAIIPGIIFLLFGLFSIYVSIFGKQVSELTVEEERGLYRYQETVTKVMDKSEFIKKLTRFVERSKNRK